MTDPSAEQPSLQPLQPTAEQPAAEQLAAERPAQLRLMLIVNPNAAGGRTLRRLPDVVATLRRGGADVRVEQTRDLAPRRRAHRRGGR